MEESIYMDKQSDSPEFKKVIGLLKNDLIEYFGDRIQRIILYGSYARGDYNNNSDVDIMILVNDMPNLKDDKFVSRLSYNYMYDYNILFSIMLQSLSKFENVIDFYPYYRNIVAEGLFL